MLGDYPPDMETTTDNQSASVIQIDSGKHIAVVALCAALCGMSIVLAGWSAYIATKAERETRMQQYYLLELDAKVIEVPPADSQKLREIADRSMPQCSAMDALAILRILWRLVRQI
jgi:hypothetical protein